MNVNIHQPLPDDIRERMIPSWFHSGLFPSPEEKLELSDSEWRQRLSDDEYRVLRTGGTEPPFTGECNQTKTDGIYLCRGCSNPVFASVCKFDSGTGWPSFFAPISPEHIGVKPDHSLRMERTEVHCARCGGHFGHVFDDGPEPTGLRYCLNSTSLLLVDKEAHRKIAEDHDQS